MTCPMWAGRSPTGVSAAARPMRTSRTSRPLPHREDGVRFRDAHNAVVWWDGSRVRLAPSSVMSACRRLGLRAVNAALIMPATYVCSRLPFGNRKNSCMQHCTATNSFPDDHSVRSCPDATMAATIRIAKNRGCVDRVHTSWYGLMHVAKYTRMRDS